MAGIDFGALLDNTVKAYQTVSVARAERDTVKYQNAGIGQQAMLHNSTALTPLEAYQTGNAANPGAVPTVGGYIDRIPKPLLYGSLGLLGIGLLIRAVK